MIIRWISLAAVFALALSAGFVEAKTPVKQYSGSAIEPGSGGGDTGGGSISGCDVAGTGVCAQFQHGQSFVTWPDIASGASGAAWKYDVYRSTSPMTSATYGLATRIASRLSNNSAQLFGGDPAHVSDNYFSSTYRQDGTRPMSRLSDLGPTLPLWSGLQVHTALVNQNAYYAVVGVTGGVDTYIGSVGPISESVEATEPIKIADSLARGVTYGKITSPGGLPIILILHGSSVNTGCNTQICQDGDYWTFFMPLNASTWQEGRPFTWTVIQDNAQQFVGTPSSLEVRSRDGILSDLNTEIETSHWGIGMTPLSGIANRMYPVTTNADAYALKWTARHYGADINQIHCVGHSMGAWGSANSCMRMTDPPVSAIWAQIPIWQMYRRGPAGWAGTFWTNSMAFRATTLPCPTCLGLDSTSVLTDTGAVWGGTGGDADTPNWITTHPDVDFPFAAWTVTKDDTFASLEEQLIADAAFRVNHDGYAWNWTMGLHDTTFDTFGAIDADNFGAIAGVAYHKSQFKRNFAYIAFANSTIDDDPGTDTATALGYRDGDFTGCINCGFTWTIAADTAAAFNFDVGSNWMGLPPTTSPQTTLTGTMASSGSGSVSITSSAGFKSVSGLQNKYFLVGGTEIILVSATPAANSISYTSRGLLGTTASAHSAGETIRQISSKPTGPVHGPYVTMNADFTPHRIQAFDKGKTNGQVISCDVTPFGESTSTVTATVVHKVFTLPAVKINVDGSTHVACH